MTETFDRFRAAVMADEPFQLELASLDRPDEFVRAAIAGAAERGIALGPEEFGAVCGADPLGLRSLRAASQGEHAWPPRQWLPLRHAPESASVEWIHFAGKPLLAPFFGHDAQALRASPFNRLFAYRTPLDTFLRSPRDHSLAPDGFIFHMSRCGSTLVSQMLAAVPANIVVSEAEPLDTIVQLPTFDPLVSPERHVAAVRAMVAALGRDRSGRSRRYFVKLDSWHALALPLFRAAFPATPWVFLYRDPIEVLVSQARMNGRQVVPGVIPPAFFGFAPSEAAIPNADYAARVLARICEAAIEHHDLGGGLLVDYRELPQAAFTRILPHFGAAPDAGERALMQAASERDAKAPWARFEPDGDAKRREATAEVRAAAGRHLRGAYARLEALRAGQ